MPHDANTFASDPFPRFTPDPPIDRGTHAERQRRVDLRWSAARLFVSGCGAGFLGAIIMCTEAGRFGFFCMISLWCLAGAQYLRSRRDAVPKGAPPK